MASIMLKQSTGIGQNDILKTTPVSTTPANPTSSMNSTNPTSSGVFKRVGEVLRQMDPQVVLNNSVPPIASTLTFKPTSTLTSTSTSS